MTASDLLTVDEQVVLASLIASPRQLAWEIDGLAPDLFRPGPCRVVAAAICGLRDSHQLRWRWRHVVWRLRRQGYRREADFARALYWGIGTSIGVTAAMSRLYKARAERAAGRAA